MTDREIELQLRIMSKEVFDELLRIFPSRRKHALYRYIMRTKPIYDDVVHEVLRVVDYIDLPLGLNGDKVRANIYERGLSVEDRLVIHLDVEVKDENERNQLMARLQEHYLGWIPFKP